MTSTSLLRSMFCTCIDIIQGMSNSQSERNSGLYSSFNKEHYIFREMMKQEKVFEPQRAFNCGMQINGILLDRFF